MRYVDLGLPSGTKWADTNVGSFTPYEYGKLFSFEEAIELGVDLPSLRQINELSGLCQRVWCAQNGINGCMFIGTNGNKIFMPAAGRVEIFGECKGRGENGFYWTSEKGGVSPNLAWMLMICNQFATDGCQNVNRKHSVRGVI